MKIVNEIFGMNRRAICAAEPGENLLGTALEHLLAERNSQGVFSLFSGNYNPRCSEASRLY